MKKINFKRLVARNNRLILAYEKKYAKQIGGALQKQLKGYVNNGILSDEVTPVLTDMYMSVGERFYLNQYRLLSDVSQKSLFIDAFKIWWTDYTRNVLAGKVTRINETTLTKLQNSLGDLVPQSLPFREMAERLMNDFDFSPQRAMMISRTEVGNSMNEAKFKAKDDIKDELGEEIWKIWIHRGSKNPRDWHVRLDDGKAIHEDDVWRVEVPSSGMTEAMSRPHDPEASAENVINCGCEVMYVSYSYAKNNGMVDVTDYPIAQPTREIEAPQANETVTVGDLPPSTDKTISNDIKEVFEQSDMNISSVRFNKELSLEDKNLYKNELNKLLNDYKLDGVYSESDKVGLSFNSTKDYMGQVVTENDKVIRMNFGHRNSELAIEATNVSYRRDGVNLSLGEFSLIDKANSKLGTLTHEFAHVITDPYRNSGKGFFKELDVIRNEYIKESRKLLDAKDKDGLSKIFLGKYASTNVDEFMAEGFKEYKLRSNPSPYALRIGKLIDKHFKK